jgi:quercetin 2,3-dioxygenase
MATVTFKTGGRLQIAVPASRNIFLYVVRGELQINSQAVRVHHLIEFGDTGEMVKISALSDAVILFGHADPIGEPVVAHGPFVMNTREEITQAIRDFQEKGVGGRG